MIKNSGYIFGVGKGQGGEEITEARYDEIMAVIRNRPAPKEGTGLRLRLDLTWEEFKIEPVDDPEVEDAEAVAILTGGAAT